MNFKTFENAIAQVQDRLNGCHDMPQRKVFAPHWETFDLIEVEDYTRKGIHQEAEYGFYPLENVRLEVRDGQLVFELDEYGASGDAEADGSNWDVDEWEKRKIGITIDPIDRNAWKTGYRFMRLLLKGHTVEIFQNGKRFTFLGVGIRQWRRK